MPIAVTVSPCLSTMAADRAALGAQRHANADFPGSQPHPVRQHPEQSERGERQGDEREGQQDPQREYPLRRPRPIAGRGSSAGTSPAGVEPGNGLPDRELDVAAEPVVATTWVSAQLRSPANCRMRVVDVHIRIDLHCPLRHVVDHTDDLALAATGVECLADGLDIGIQPSRPGSG